MTRTTKLTSIAELRNIGKAMLKDFELLRIKTVKQLAHCDADELYARIQKLTHSRHDPCVLDTYAAAIHQAKTGEALAWWEFTKVRKQRQGKETISRSALSMNDDVAAVFSNYSTKIRSRLKSLRKLILDTAAETPGVGVITETLKWSQPSYLTSQTGSGSLIRIDQIKGSSEKYGMFFHCQTTLIEDFRRLYPNDFKFDGNRCLVFDVEKPVPVAKLRECIALAFTYHQRKKR
jgi:Pathogenicity locus/Domain of unknown function (DU1801)